MRRIVVLYCYFTLMHAPFALSQEGEIPATVDEKVPTEAEPEPPVTKVDVKETPAAPAAEAKSDPSYGLLGPVRIGATASAEFPHLLNYSLELKYKKMVGFAFALGRYKTEVKEMELEMRNWDIKTRWFPFEGSFFLGIAYGKQNLVGRTSKDLKVKFADHSLEIPTTLRLEVETTYLTPHLGWFAVWDIGFTLGFEIGYQMALQSKAELQTGFEDVSEETEEAVEDSAEYKKKKKELEDISEQYGKKSVPYIALLRLGWMI